MVKEDVSKSLSEIAKKYDNLRVEDAEWDEGKLTVKLAIKGGPQPPDLPNNVEVLSYQEDDAIGSVYPIEKSAMTRIELDPLTRDYLDLAPTSVLDESPQRLYQRSINYYRSKDVFGTTINVLTNFAAKGFENDIDDLTIKNFFDNWVIDVGFDDIVEKIFFDFFRVGIVRTYKILGKYEPKINQLSTIPGEKAKVARKEKGARGNRFTKSFIPIAYTILNPTFIEIKGSLLFGQTATYLKAKAGAEIKKILDLPAEKLSEEQKRIIKSLPADFKKAVQSGQDIPLDPNLIGEIDYRRMPYERYPIPRAVRAFDAVDFKDELKKADYSTLDGITNYILKITVGNDQAPVTKQETLDRVGELFNTVSKSFKVVWNHTLDVEKITSPEIGDILGPDKYEQVNSDITAALGMIRGLVDGTGGASVADAELAVKSIIEEINYARRQVQRWIYSEYRSVAEAVGFERFPKVRFDDMALRDEIQMMSIVQGMIDRRIISYRTGQKKLGFDPDTELAQMERELKLVESGVLGIKGSPFQQYKGGDFSQPNQGTPRGTPSEGRPRGRPAKTPEEKDETRNNSSDTAAKKEAFVDQLSSMSIEEMEQLLKELIYKKTLGKK